MYIALVCKLWPYLGSLSVYSKNSTVLESQIKKPAVNSWIFLNNITIYLELDTPCVWVLIL